MTATALYYNPNCSKCRAALVLLKERGIEPRLIDYRANPPPPAELTTLQQILGLPDIRHMMRQGDADYAVLALDAPGLSQAELLAALASHPHLLEHPIFVHHGRAVIGRPPERVLEIL